MKATLKKSLKLEKRTIRKLDVRSGLHGGRQFGPGENDYTEVTCFSCDVGCDTVTDCLPASDFTVTGYGNGK